MYNFLEQRTKEKNTSSEDVSVAPKATQYYTKHDSSKETSCTSSSRTLDFSKKQFIKS